MTITRSVRQEDRVTGEDRRRTLVKTGIASSGNRPPRAWIIRAVSGEAAGREASVGSRPLILGADADCDLVLTDPTVSRRHTQVRATAEGIEVTDLDSTNGTFYRSSRISEVVLSEDASLQLGGVAVQICSRPVPSVDPSERRRFGGLIGQSLSMREVFAVLELAAPTGATVMVEGESGTGKELVARALHDHSERAEGPFVVVDCSAANEQLIESQLFGHKAGAFTGAVRERKGAFVEAHGGTLFLDEIGELPAVSQAKLLRALEARTVQPLGSDRPVDVDVRVITATHRDLQRMVEEKTFRFDLYHRLAVVFLRMPPLRERPDDIPLLVNHFFEGRGVEPGGIGGPNLSKLERHDWPGNVRELRNVLERAWVLSGPRGAGFSDLRIDLHAAPGMSTSGGGPSVDTGLPFKEAKERWNDVFERRYIQEVYRAFDENITRASEHAGINRNHFRKLLLKHGIIKS